MDVKALYPKILEIEKACLAQPNNIPRLKALFTLLSKNLPPFGDQIVQISQNLAGIDKEEIARKIFDNPADFPNVFAGLSQKVERLRVMERVTIAQLYWGETVSALNNHETDCPTQFKIFDEEKIIPGACFQCFKVQLLPASVIDLVRLHFLLPKLRFGQAHRRKCMVELRKAVTFPYKGYIYCGSEQEANDCLEATLTAAHQIGLKFARAGISHGCSEFGHAYPKFKFQKDGKHRGFVQPKAWIEAEKTKRQALPKPGGSSVVCELPMLSIKEVLGLNSWITYAKVIGDESAGQFINVPGQLNQKFVARVSSQAKQRKAELKELISL